MKTPDVMVAIAAALAAACARTGADRAPPLYQYDGASDPIPEARRDHVTATNPRPPVDRPPVDRPPVDRPPVRADEPEDDRIPLTVSGIALEPTLSAACQLPPSPKAFFEFDSADLDSRDVVILRRIAACLTDGPLRGHAVELVGRTDPLGSPDYNELLALARAEAVREFLLNHGVPAQNTAVRVAAEAFADPLWPPGWAYDRRVDIRLIQH